MSEEKTLKRGSGELVIKQAVKKGTGTKIAVAVLTGPVGYLLWGRDKTKKKGIEGELILTNKRLVIVGDKGQTELPIDKIGAIRETGRIGKSLDITLSSILEGEAADISFELKSKDLEDWKRAFKQLQMEKLGIP